MFQYILFGINCLGCILSASIIIYHAVRSERLQILAYHGDETAAKHIMLPCYKPLFLGLILLFCSLAIFQALSCLRPLHARITFAIVQYNGLCIVAVLTIVPALLVQSSVSAKGFWRAFFHIFPWYLCCTGLWICWVCLSSSRVVTIMGLEIAFLILATIPPCALAFGILSKFMSSRVQVGSVSNRNAMELLFVFSLGYLAITAAAVSVVSTHQSQDAHHEVKYMELAICQTVLNVIANVLFPFAAYRTLLADTKFWRGLGRHNQGGIRFSEQIEAGDQARPTIDLSVVSNSFQEMMSNISDIVVDFAFIQVDKKIGQGASAEVYCGRFGTNIVAIKVSTPPEVTQEVIDVFVAEARISSWFRHENIVTFHGICVRPPQIGMVFDLCENGNLKESITKNPGKWSRAMRVQACRDAAAAVSHVHKKGFIHRDLKAENFFVGKGMVIKLGDFGETIRQRTLESTVNDKMAIVGSVPFMAPELIRSAKHYTEAVDIYALAVTFWEIWTSKDPYDGLTSFQIYSKVGNGGRPDIPEKCPAKFAELLQTGWAQDPNLRPTGDNMVQTLQAVASEEGGDPAQQHAHTDTAHATHSFHLEAYLPAPLLTPQQALGRSSWAILSELMFGTAGSSSKSATAPAPPQSSQQSLAVVNNPTNSEPTTHASLQSESTVNNALHHSL